MSAQPERTPEITIADWQVTPVIIKTGGDDIPTDGDVADAGRFPVTINLMNKTFESPIQDDGWRSAQSTVTAGIISLAIQDGVTNVGIFTATPESEELVTVQIIYGPDLLVIGEEALPEPHRTRIGITSPVTFRVLEQGMRADRWIESSASFPAVNPLVLFTQGRHVLANYQCQTGDVELTLGLDWDETGG